MREIWQVAMSNLWATLVMSALLGAVGVVHGRIFFYQNDGQKSRTKFRKLFLGVLCCALTLLALCVWISAAAFVSAAVLSTIFMVLVFAVCMELSWRAHSTYYSLTAYGDQIG